MNKTGVLFANYDLQSSPSPKQSKDWKFSSSISSTSLHKASTGNTSVKSLFGSPASANESNFLLSGYKIPSDSFSSVEAWAPPSSPNTSSVHSQRPLDTSSLGYLAFPSPEVLTTNNTSHTQDTESPAVIKELGPSSPAPAIPLHDKHRLRVEREQAEIIRGEEDWVRSGGILRDSEGKRDFARTEKIREEIRLREWEAEVKERWDEYERRWRELQAKERSAESLSFHDFPWPVHITSKKGDANGKPSSGTWNKTPVSPKISVSDLTLSNVETFFVEGLKVRGCKVTRKERIRSGLLRWHPDKMTAVVAKVVENERRDVEDGISAVVRCLQEMNPRH